ncbi:MAG: BREX-1 system adenine-specific DNA-methyltransferase PglX, partial [Sphaerochaeta sp.]|nr:BREX-1 system adenine-specific DNA-methyltransferase PglX [Sphaerochaeta sp.]
MLTYAFDLLYAIYEEEGYEPAEIPEKILTNNLYGIEIDERAGELAAFALTMKARAKQRRFFRKAVKPNICVLEKVKFDDGELAAVGSEKWVVGSEKQQALHYDLNLFEEADNFGSLLRPQLPLEDIESLQQTIHSTLSTSHSLFDSMTHQKVLQALRQADYLSPKYHVVIANPPYMGGKGMNGRLGAWAKDNYPNSKSDLFAMFIERNLDLTQKHGAVAMITMQSWMFLSSFEALRARLLGQNTVLSMAHLGARAFDSIGGEVVSTTAFVLENSNRLDYKGGYLRLVAGNSEDEKDAAIREAVMNPDCGWFYRAAAADFKKMPGSPIAYWVSPQVGNAFQDSRPIEHYFPVNPGIRTGKDEWFLRLWFEVSQNRTQFKLRGSEQMAPSTKWFPLHKGGNFRKWYGNAEHVIDLWNDGENIKTKSPDFRLRDAKWYFKPFVSWSRISSADIAFRYFPQGVLFSDAGPGIFAEKNCLEVMSLLNSKLGNLFLKIINPTLNYQKQDIEAVPYIRIGSSSDVDKAVEYEKIDWDSYETSWDFTILPLLNPDYRQPTLKATCQKLRAHWRDMTLEMQRLEEENNRIFIEAYGLQDELKPEVPLNEITLTCNPHYRYGVEECEVGSEKWEDMEARLLQDTVKDLVSYAVGCMFGRYALDKPGLILANQG